MKLDIFDLPETLAGVTLDLIRHGQSTTNLDGIVCGQMDPTLSPLGTAQAEALVQLLPGYAPDYAYVSPLQRARQTIAPLGLAGVNVERALMEVDTGSYSPMRVDEMWVRYPNHKYQGRMPNLAYPQGESLKQAIGRVWSWFRTICGQWHPGSHVMIAGHEGTVCAILHGLLSIDLWAYPTFTIANASVTRITWDEALHMRIAIGHKLVSP
jgi:broad specificity phosphatase PhoE